MCIRDSSKSEAGLPPLQSPQFPRAGIPKSKPKSVSTPDARTRAPVIPQTKKIPATRSYKSVIRIFIRRFSFNCPWSSIFRYYPFYLVALMRPQFPGIPPSPSLPMTCSSSATFWSATTKRKLHQPSGLYETAYPTAVSYTHLYCIV